MNVGRPYQCGLHSVNLTADSFEVVSILLSKEVKNNRYLLTYIIYALQ